MADSHRMQPNRLQETGYAGVGITFGRVPLVLDPAGLAGADVAILGAPFDEGVSYRPGTRFGPRAIRTAEDVAFPVARPHMELGVDPYAELDIVDYGDVEVRPSDLDRSHAALRQGVAEILAAGAIPIVLGGDHSLSTPVLQALADHHGADGFSVVHFDTHADTGNDEWRGAARRALPPGRRRRPPERAQHRPDRPARRMAVPRGLPVDARGGIPLAHHGRDRRARHRPGRARRRSSTPARAPRAPT